MQPKRIAVVLDIDGTLIDSDSFLTVSRRPHVDAFLDFCFAQCAAVAIWTNASSSWAQSVVDILRDRDGRVRPWAFVWSGSKSTPVWKSRGSLYDGGWWLGDGCHDLHANAPGAKRLGKVFKGRQRAAQGFVPSRTIIIEDTPSNCRHNFGNAVYVPSYELGADGAEADGVLDVLLQYLQHLQHACDDVRSVEKRGWLYDQASWRAPVRVTSDRDRPCACWTCLQPAALQQERREEVPTR